jgi:hypothetical protein
LITIRNKKCLYYLLLVIIIIWAFWLRLIEIDNPWIGHHDFNGTWISLAAENYLKYGFFETKFGSTTNSGIIPDGKYTYYIHHPPLICWLVSLSFMVYGSSENSARIVSIYLSLCTIFLIFLICTLLFDYNLALLAALIQTLLPMDAFFGRFVNHEPLILFLAMLTFYLYLKWIEDNKYFPFLVGSTIIGCLSGWSYYYLPGLLFLHYQIFVKKTWQLKKIIILPIICIISFLAFLLYIQLLTGSINGGDYGSIFEAFKVRISSKTIINFTIGEFLLTEYNRILDLFTPIITVFTIFYLLTFISYPKLRLENKGIFLMLLMLFGILHPLVFKQQAYVHDYLLFNLSPFMSITSAIVILELTKILSSHFRIPIALFPIIFVLSYMNLSKPSLLKLHEVRNLEEEYKLGVYLKNYTRPDELIMSSLDNGSSELQLKYYSQRHLSSNISSKYDMAKLLDDGKGKYHFFLDDKESGKSDILEDYLIDNFKCKSMGRFILYDLKNKPDKNMEKSEKVVKPSIRSKDYQNPDGGLNSVNHDNMENP